jgi:hypothetical protein
MKRVDLLDIPAWPYAFSQRHLLTASEFCREAERRGGRLDPRQLEAFHRAGVLVPLYQIGPMQWRVDRVDGGGHRDLLRIRDAGGLQDPRVAGYVPWSRFRSRTGPIRRYTRHFLYSWYQLLAVPDLVRLQSRLRPRPAPLAGRRYELKLRPGESRELVGTDLIALLTRLEPAYLPQIRLRLSGGLHPKGVEAWSDEFATYERDFRATPVLREFDIDGEEIRKMAERLLLSAGFIDPIRAWLPLVRNMTPDSWEELSGLALSAVDARVAAEILLRFHSELVDEGAAQPLPDIPEMASHPLRERIQRTPEDLDPILMDYGLSPHPAVLVVLEGPSDMLLAARTMQQVGIRRARSFIELTQSGGVDRDVSLLAAFASTPELGRQLEGAALARRPVTRFLRVIDEEGLMKGAGRIQVVRDRLVNQLEGTLALAGTPAIDRRDLERLIEIFSWGPLPMEFANFTNREIAGAISQLRGSPGSVRSDQIATARKSKNPGSSLKHMLKGPPPIDKMQLADALWPALSRRIARAQAAGKPDSTPMLRLVIRAARLAVESPRSNLAIRLKP